MISEQTASSMIIVERIMKLWKWRCRENSDQLGLVSLSGQMLEPRKLICEGEYY